MKTKRHKNNNMLVWACAWCSIDTYKTLKKGQNYTHGICLNHKKEWLRKFLGNIGLARS